MVVGVEPTQPACGVGTGRLLDDEQHTAMGAKRHDLGAYQSRRGRIPTEQRRHPNLQGRSTPREATTFGESRPELHEVVVSLLHGITDEIVDDVADVLELARTEAREILEADPQLQKPENRPIKGLVERWWKGRMELTLSG